MLSSISMNKFNNIYHRNSITNAWADDIKHYYLYGVGPKQ